MLRFILLVCIAIPLQSVSLGPRNWNGVGVDLEWTEQSKRQNPDINWWLNFRWKSLLLGFDQKRYTDDTFDFYSQKSRPGFYFSQSLGMGLVFDRIGFLAGYCHDIQSYRFIYTGYRLSRSNVIFYYAENLRIGFRHYQLQVHDTRNNPRIFLGLSATYHLYFTEQSILFGMTFEGEYFRSGAGYESIHSKYSRNETYQKSKKIIFAEFKDFNPATNKTKRLNERKTKEKLKREYESKIFPLSVSELIQVGFILADALVISKLSRNPAAYNKYINNLERKAKYKLELLQKKKAERK